MRYNQTNAITDRIMTPERTLYSILGIDESSDPAVIETAYHHCRQKGEEEASLLRMSYETLSHPDLRAAYDRKLQRSRLAQPATRLSGEEPGNRRPFRFRLSLFFLAALIPGVYLWNKDSPVISGKTEAERVKTGVSAEPSPIRESPPADPANTGTPPPENIPAPSASSAGASSHFETAPAPRERNKPGFDPQYLAWSVFTLRQRRSSGSGVLIAPDKILTNCHVLAGAALDGMIAIHSQTQKITKVEKYARLDGEDACVVYAPNAGGDPVEWGDSSSLKQGDALHSFGHPGGSTEIIWSEGQFVSRAERNGQTFLLSSNYCRPGSSGGPLLDGNGRLVGIVTAVQRYVSAAGQPSSYGACVSLTENTARALLSRPLFPIGFAPAQFTPNY